MDFIYLLYGAGFLLLALALFFWSRCGLYSGGWQWFNILFAILFLIFGIYGLYKAFTSRGTFCPSGRMW